MLLDAAAFLLTSALLAPVAGAFVVQADSTPVGGSSSLSRENSQPIPFLSGATPSLLAEGAPGFRASVASGGPSLTPVPAEQLKLLSGAPLLDQLTLLPSGSLAAFVASSPQSIAAMIASPPPAREVSRWWGTLTTLRQWTMLSAAPALVGNLDGIPAAARDYANRLWLDETVAGLEKSLASVGRSAADEAARRIHMLGQLDGALARSPGGATRSLLSIDATGQGRAAIVVGDLTTADFVTYLIPGMFFTVDGQMGDWAAAASRLHDDQVRWLRLIQEADAAPQTVAVVAWMGYETPNLTNAGGIELAEAGRDSLARVIEGLIAERAGAAPHITIAAHSYGSTAALMALTDYDFEVDALAVVGSPGSTARSVADLNVRNANVFTGEADWDWIPNSSFFGSDPGSESYGAKRMNVAGGVDVITGQLLIGSIGHNEYFAADSESMRNIALIGIGQGVLVTDGSPRDQLKTLAMVERQSAG